MCKYNTCDVWIVFATYNVKILKAKYDDQSAWFLEVSKVELKMSKLYPWLTAIRSTSFYKWKYRFLFKLFVCILLNTINHTPLLLLKTGHRSVKHWYEHYVTPIFSVLLENTKKCQLCNRHIWEFPILGSETNF